MFKHPFAVAVLPSALAVLITAATPAKADTVASFDGRTESLLVQHSDLDLASAAGRQVFQQRLRNAADQLCNTSNLVPLSVRKNCKAAVAESAMAQLPQAFKNELRLAGR